ncbi:tetratricopeptide repeat protein [Caenimonas sedimenti]|uniref:protein O-GlcNAc transferase n=1 Tax=Caenimonas sedimenti TaxID=2596921 RepID=A0A562ZGY8_9BURK|nr:tetratricopeptide repeat protein [Caenimonas sedimenti]TWO67842.1 tetratricopeptide repeat protein [Caenimonas sedimenti]
MNAPLAPSPDETRRAVGLFQADALAELEPLARGFTQRYAQHPLGWMLLGALLKKQGRLPEALAPMQRAAELLPDKAELHNNLGSTYQGLQRFEEAEACYRRALVAQPAHFDALYNLAQLQSGLNRLPEAEANYLAALRLNPDDAQACFSLAVVLAWQERWIDAEPWYRRAIALKPGSAMVHDTLGHALLEQGRALDALAEGRRALEIDPDSMQLLSNFLFTANYAPATEATGLRPQARRFGELAALAAPRPYTTWRCDAQPKLLRVGLVSGDFRRHAVATFLQSVLAHADAHGVELVAYSTNAHEDDVTAALKPRFARWRSIATSSLADAAKAIRDDGVHILIDLAGHTGHHRLDVFAQAPAPVQVSWLGSIASTGVRQIRHVLTDPHATQPGDAVHFAEQPWALPESWACYAPPGGDQPVHPLPARANGFITFGSFNNLPKLSEPTVRTWAAVLQAVPGAHLYLKNRQLGSPGMQAQVRARFEAHGIAAERMTLQGPVASTAGHLSEYSKLDIALDPFPYPGCTTSVEAHYMGVPVLTLRGSGALLRLGESIARNLGLEDWIASDEADYVEKAVRAARDLDRLEQLRRELRPRMEASALLNAPRWAGGFFAALWEMWRRR